MPKIIIIKKKNEQCTKIFIYRDLKYYLKGPSHSEILPGIEVKNWRLIVQILFKLYSKNRKRKSGQTFYVSDLLDDLIGRSIKTANNKLYCSLVVFMTHSAWFSRRLLRISPGFGFAVCRR